MLEDSAQDSLLDQEETLPTTTTAIHNPKKLSIIPLIFLIYFEVSGGAYGEEAAVGAAGPLWAILGFLIFPFIWSIPEALVTAELATAFPGNGGYVIWAHRAFGPFWGSLMGSWKFLSGVINLASYPVLCVDYIKLVFPLLSSGLPRYAAILFSTLFLSFLNYTGLVIVGYTAVCLGVISLIPFLLLALFSIPMIDPSRWISLGNQGVEKNWSLFFNTLFWNLNFWDNASTLAGEVEQPQKTFPKALFSAGLLTCLAYLVPLLAATGATPLNQASLGKWLKVFLEIGAVLSIIGLYEAQLSSCVYQLLGMAELGFLPQCFSVRSKCLGMLLEFASFLWLRRKLPTMKRPFKVPMKLPGLVVMCLIPSGFLVYIMSVATGTVFSVSCLVTLVTVVWYFVMRFCKSKRPTNVEDEGLEQVG
uniref:Amino acid permease/ SLC12A domain-containing protein n=1 Tax=Gossypium raimondii TaxID=29730 RepID=A0A0D2P977_GOSRA|nr:hypothetical protein B456_004G094200 [Gossypium raimondii]